MAKRRALFWVLTSAAAVVAIALLARTSYVAGREFSLTMPRVGFVETELPLGVFEWGSTAKSELHFENRTSTSVTLAGVSSSCGCAVVPGREAYEKRVVHAGEVVAIPVELAVGTTGPTRSAKIVAILDDGRQFSSLVKAQVRHGWNISTQHIDIGDVRLGAPEAVSREFSFLSAGDRLTEVNSGARWLAATVTDAREKRQVVTVRVDPRKLPPGVNRTVLQFTTTSKTVPKGSIQVTARGLTDLVPVPPKVFLRPGASATAKFVNTDGTAVALESVEVLYSNIQTELRDGGVVLITASANPRVPSGTPVRVRDRSGREGEVQVTIVHLKGEKP